MKPLFLVAIGGLALAGCVTDQQQRLTEARSQYAQATMECDAKYPRVVGGMVGRMTCINKANARYLRPLSDQPDLNNLAMATNIYWAAKVDKREVSLEEGTLQVAKATSDINSEGAQRNNAARAANAQERAALAQSLMAVQEAQRARAAATPALTFTPMPRPVTCTSSGPYAMRTTECQ